MRGTAALTVAIIAIVGCATLTPEGAKVRSTSNSIATTGCKFLGRIEGVTNMWGGRDTETKVRNEAAKLGADTLLYPAGGRFVHLYGEAYLCGAPGVPVRPANEPPSGMSAPQPTPTPGR